MTEKMRKNAVWTFNNNTNVCSVTFPDGKRGNFDLSSVVVGLNPQQKLIYMYGFKQLVSSNAAAEKTSTDKIMSFTADYEDIIAGKVIMFGEGKIGFDGRTRANAKTYDAKVLEKLETLSPEDCKAMLVMVKQGFMKLSAELLEAVEEKAKSDQESEEGEE